MWIVTHCPKILEPFDSASYVEIPTVKSTRRNIWRKPERKRKSRSLSVVQLLSIVATTTTTNRPTSKHDVLITLSTSLSSAVVLSSSSQSSLFLQLSKQQQTTTRNRLTSHLINGVSSNELTQKKKQVRSHKYVDSQANVQTHTRCDSKTCQCE